VQMDRTKRGSNNDYIRAINTYLIPFYGNYNIDRITQLVVNDFHIWRNEKTDRVLSHSAQANHNAAMNLVLDKAIELGNLLAMQKPILKNTGEGSDRRPDFTQDEIKQLFAYMPKWTILARKGREREIRELLCLYVGFAATTGTRTGTEMKFVEWRNINIKETNDEPVIYIILQKGKTIKKNKPQTMVLHRSCVLYFEKLKKFNVKLANQSLQDIVKARHADLVFQLSDGTQPTSFIRQFKRLLIDANLLLCAVTGKVRTLYSLRHYAITQAIERGLTAEQLQPQYRTAANMISKYYNHLDPLKNADYFTGEKDADSAQEEEISRLLNNVPNDPMLSLAEMSTGLQMILVNINKAATENLRQELQSATAPVK
jgi:integrase